MEVQNFRGYNPIGESGCYFCSLGKLAESITGKALTPEQVSKVYAEAVCSNVMEWNCYMKHPDTVLYLFMYELGERGHLVKFIGWWNADMKDAEPEMFGRWKFDDVTHEVIRRECGKGHHFGLHNWNPWPELECGPFNGRRLFKIETTDEDEAA